MLSRRFRFWLVVGLLTSNLAVGILSLFFLRSVNQRYAQLFERSIPVVNNLRTLTRELSYVQRLARRIVDPRNEPDWVKLVPLMDDSIAKARTHALEISTAELFRGTPHSAAIVASSRDYTTKAAEYLALVRLNKLEEANRYNNDVLRPGYDNLQVTLDAAADFVESQSSNLRDRYTQESRFLGGLLLAFAGWPVIAAGVAVVALALLIIILLVTVFIPEFGWSKRSESGGSKP